MATPNPKVKAWVDRLSESDVPVLNDTVQQLGDAAGNRETSARELADVILSDAAMTSGVLRVANSAYYGSASREISTISRAVVLLGFETVRAIGASVAVIESFLKHPAHQSLLSVMRDSVHAAVQAKAIATLAGDPQPEEIFVAALLSRLGEMAFWAFASEAQAQALQDAMAEPGVPRRQAEREVLGFTLNELTHSLARAWNLGELVQEASGKLSRTSPRARTVRLGHEFQTAVRSHGWDAPQVERLTREIGEHAGVQQQQVTERLAASQEEMKQAARAFGVGAEAVDETGRAADAEETADEAGPQPSPQVQLQVLRELTQVLRDGPDLQTVLDMILEGIYRGVGMDRTLVAILTRDRKRLTVRYALGDSGRLREAFGFELDDPRRLLFRQTLANQRPIWVSRMDDAELIRLVPRDVVKTFAPDFHLAPLVIRGRDIGLIYADRWQSQRALDEESFEAFSHFSEQANAALEQLKKQ